ncbi:UDP-4-amino-4,6-dideoxy-N-acetyl-beta-L-altrosamine N-acetyltransferase [Acidobacteria bacterium AH-259-D05]|nr:UDP-4-amino-4,6-dideoxy-N-acetyl-beta-L-altrosamine N-acetyltransferase [Acidobacteria bacterium AH-259-D05]
MNWRVRPDVSRSMLIDVEYDLEKQLAWYRKISPEETCRYWIISFEKTPVGVINLAEIDLQNRRCNVGYYIGETRYRYLGAMVPPYFYNYIFFELNMNKIFGEVLEGNENVLKIHDLHGYRKVGVAREHVRKNDRFLDVIIVELLRKDWLKRTQYHKYVSEF